MLPKIPLHTSNMKAMPRYSTRFGHTRNDPPRVGQKGDTHPLDKEDIGRAVVAHFWAQMERRFWAHVSKGLPDECWEWRGTKRGNGYGFLRFWVLPGNPEIKASRIMWLLVHGSVPVDRLLCHTCDNPACVNPDHLFLGTQQENIQDMVRKGRHSSHRGYKNPAARLNESQVREIRRLSDEGQSLRSLASQYGVSVGCVSLIRSRRTWKEVA